MINKMAKMGFLIFLLAVVSSAVWAISLGVPSRVSFSGRLTDNAGEPIETSQSVTFSLWDSQSPGSGNQLGGWSETHTVTPVKGVFSVILGSVSAIPSSIFDKNNTYTNVYLQVDLGSSVGSGSLSPRQQILAVPFAFRAAVADTADFAIALQDPGAVQDSDWEISGSDIYRDSGKVGIRTTTPGHELDTQGVIRSLANVEPPPASPTSGKGLEMYYYMNEGHDLNDAGYLTSYDRGAGQFKNLRLYGNVISLVNGGGGIGAGEHGVAFMSRHLASQGPGLYMGYVADGSDVTGAFIRQGGTSASGVGTLDLGTIGAKQAMRIAYDGKVGIGTTSPAEKLHVYGTGAVRTLVKSSNGAAYYDADCAANTGNSGLKLMEAGVAKAYIYWNAPLDRLSFYEGGSDRLTIKGGNVGIGTTTPGKKLDVKGDLRIGDGTQKATLFFDEINGAEWHISTFGYKLNFNNDAWDTKMVIQQDGKVGIGTETPEVMLEVESSGAAIRGESETGHGVTGTSGGSNKAGIQGYSSAFDAVSGLTSGSGGAAVRGVAGVNDAWAGHFSGGLGVYAQKLQTDTEMDIQGNLKINKGTALATSANNYTVTINKITGFVEARTTNIITVNNSYVKQGSLIILTFYDPDLNYDQGVGIVEQDTGYFKLKFRNVGGTGTKVNPRGGSGAGFYFLVIN